MQYAIPVANKESSDPALSARLESSEFSPPVEQENDLLDVRATSKAPANTPHPFLSGGLLNRFKDSAPHAAIPQ